MGKYKHEGKGRNISVGGGQERKDLFKDMSGGYNAMGDSNSPNYQYNGSAFKQRYSSPMEKYGPLHGNAFGHAMQKAGGDYEKAKSMLEMKGSPMHQGKRKHQVSGVDSKAIEPKGSMKGLNKKTAPKRPKPTQPTIHINEQIKVFQNLSPRQDFEPMEKIKDPVFKSVNLDKQKLNTPLNKSSCTSGGSSKSPYKQIGNPKKEAKKYLKSIKKDPNREQKLDSIQNVYNKQFDNFDMGSKVLGGEKSFDKNYHILKRAGRDTIFGMYGKKK